MSRPTRLRAALTSARAGDWRGDGLVLARAVCGTAIGFAIACSVVTVLVTVRYPEPDRLQQVFTVATTSVAALLLTVLGTAIVCRGRGPRIGWLLVGTGAVLIFEVLVSVLATSFQAGQPVPLGRWAAWADNFTWAPLLLGAWLVLILFPDGRAPTRLARAGVLAGCTVAGLVLLFFPFGPGYLYDYPQVLSPLEPVPFLSPAAVVLHVVLRPAIPAMFLFAAACVVWRYRTSGPEIRAQIRWLGWFGLLFALVQIGQNVLPESWAAVVQIVSLLLMPLLPVVVTVAVLRYRLYDIDRLVSRTVTYALLTGLLVGVYAVVVTAVSALAHDSAGSVGVALATLAAVSVVRPLRRRLQSAVDRRFDRERFDARRAIASYAEGLRGDDRDPEAGLLGTVDRVVAPATVWLWTPPARPEDRPARVLT